MEANLIGVDELHNSYEIDQRHEARQTLRQLVLGLDLVAGLHATGENLLSDPNVIRALFLAVEALTDHDAPFSLRTYGEHLKREGYVWSPEEDAQLGCEFAQGMNLQIITEIHCRTQRAISARLVHLKLITNSDEVRSLLAWS